MLLLSHCPEMTSDTVLDQRGLNAVTAVGLFALESKEEVSDGEQFVVCSFLIMTALYFCYSVQNH